MGPVLVASDQRLYRCLETVCFPVVKSAIYVSDSVRRRFCIYMALCENEGETGSESDALDSLLDCAEVPDV